MAGLTGMLGTRPGETMRLTDPSKGLFGGYTYTTAALRKQPTAAAPVAGPAAGGGITAGGGINAGALEAIQRAKAYYAPGGGFGKGVEAGLERGRTKAMASGMQGLVSAGLAGTTMAGGLGKKYEEEVGAPTRAGVEERRAQAISGIEMAQAGMGFQAGQAGAQRSLQLYIAELQARLQREQMAMRDRSTAAPTGGYARQFPSVYDQREGEGYYPSAQPMPGGGGGGYSGLIRPGARQYDLPEDEGERFDIDFGPGTLVG